MSIRGIACDLGGLVVNLNRKMQAEALALGMGHRGEGMAPELAERMSDRKWFDLLWRFERDEIHEELFRSLAEEYLETRVPAKLFWQAHVDVFTPNEPVISSLRATKERDPELSLIVCSNVDRRRLPWILGVARVPFDTHVASYMIGRQKPAREMYDTVCARSRLGTRELLFIDDQEANVDGAREFGMAAHRYDRSDPDRDARLNETLYSHGLI